MTTDPVHEVEFIVRCRGHEYSREFYPDDWTADQVKADILWENREELYETDIEVEELRPREEL